MSRARLVTMRSPSGRLSAPIGRGPGAPAAQRGVVSTRWPKAIIRLSVWNSSAQVVSVISRWPGRWAGSTPPRGLFGSGSITQTSANVDDQLVGVGVEPVGVGLVAGLDDDLVAGPQLGHVAQRLAVRDPVRGDRVVADLPGVGGALEVAEALGEHALGDARLHRHDVVLAEPRDPDQRLGRP